VDKVEACQFEVFYGELDNAPLIEQCPVNLECKVIHILDLGSHALVIGRIEETHVSESCLTDGKPDVSKIRPITYVMSPVTRYQALGEVLAKAFSVGKELKPGQ
jgi:flavin reductase (DIM6/NTAB) family NADH-FMN oxidoreductase RutF